MRVSAAVLRAEACPKGGSLTQALVHDAISLFGCRGTSSSLAERAWLVARDAPDHCYAPNSYSAPRIPTATVFATTSTAY